MTNPGGPRDAFDFQKSTYTSAGVTCPTAQSPQADALAQISGLIPVTSAGADHGMSFCGGPDGPGNVSVFSAYSYCGDDAKTVVYCSRQIFQKPFVPGQSNSDTQVRVGNQACASQPKNAEWQDLQDRGYGQLDPALVLSSQGKACKPARSYSLRGARCTFDSSDPPFTCSILNVSEDGLGGASVFRETTDASRCNRTQSVDQDQSRILASYGFLNSGPGLAERCSLGGGALYGANRICTTSVTYDAGWPGHGQAHVDTTPKVACYAIFGKDDPDTMTVQSAPESACQSNAPSTADRTFLRGLAPDIYPYDELPATCNTLQGSPYNYQRDVAGRNPTVTRGAQRNGPKCDGSPKFDYTVSYDVPYVCTDSVQGDYYGGISTGLGSSYPMNRGNCMASHQADTQQINQNLASGWSALPGPSSDDISSELGEYCNGGGLRDFDAPADVVTDQLDQSRYRVVSHGSCYNPIC